MREVWGVLSGGPPKPSWRCVYKGLALLEHLIKNGSEMCVDEARDKLFRLKSLCDYAAYEGSADKGAGIRSKAAALVEMLQDNARVRSEREAARTLRAKLVGINQKGGMPGEDRFGGGGGSYGAYSRCAFSTTGARPLSRAPPVFVTQRLPSATPCAATAAAAAATSGRAAAAAAAG